MLNVIGAGFGRTGTESMKRALEMLGLGRCHHMYEVIEDPTQFARWQTVPVEIAPDWDTIYSDFGCAVDWPTAYYWRELSAHWPDAKVLLTVRDAESWWQSFAKTILPRLLQRRASGEIRGMGYRLIAQRTFGSRIEDADHCKAVFEAHNAAIIAEVPSDQLIVHELGAGWDDLCDRLGVPVPKDPFPRGNDSVGFEARNNAARARLEQTGLDDAMFPDAE
ncbi:MAG: sulfotransferase family protein [Pseudomonadota bacterium]